MEVAVPLPKPLTWGLGNLAVIDEHRSARVCMHPTGKRFLIELISPPLSKMPLQEELQLHRNAKVSLTPDGKIKTAITLTPEAFYAMMQAGCVLATRVANQHVDQSAPKIIEEDPAPIISEEDETCV